MTLLLLGACEGGRSEIPQVSVLGGDPLRGAAAIEEIGCGACHTIPGIDEAEGVVGPPLMFWSRRSYIAGEVPNSASNLIQWIMDPHQFEPGTAMPHLGVSEQQARDIAAYLYTLE
ncbi:c-type cytochrome [Proteobacteria bacterium 005FR1]|nr:c-type cytochrome [Proteobacteria bacterium 005FR1]